jgi:cobyrinic acid a,c-diamide synthase
VTNGLIVAAPASGSGKTLVTMALLRALRRRGMRVDAAK